MGKTLREGMRMNGGINDGENEAREDYRSVRMEGDRCPRIDDEGARGKG